MTYMKVKWRCFWIWDLTTFMRMGPILIKKDWGYCRKVVFIPSPCIKKRMTAIPGSTEKALSLMSAAYERLSERVRQSWRWRLLYLRVLIDHTLTRTEGRFHGSDLKNYFEELVSIYHAQKVHTNKVAPPDMESGP